MKPLPSFAVPLTLALVPLAPTSFAAAQESAVTARDRAFDPAREAFVETSRARYLKVLAQLRKSDVGHLSTEAQAARARALDALEAYAKRGEFGWDEKAEGLVPRFVDDAGRRCAMAELMHVSGADDLVERVTQWRNDTWVAELENDAQAKAWLAANGLTLKEAARIQGPGFTPGPPDWEAQLQPGQRHLWTDGTMSPRGQTPGPRPPAARPSTGGPPAAGSGASTGGPAVSAAPSTGSGEGPTTLSLGSTTATWQMWWEMNKIEFLRPARFRSLTETGYPGHRLSTLRERAEPLFREALKDDLAMVRASGAVALGRIAGPRASSEILPLVEDAMGLVRASALLGIGATASPEGAAILLSVAEDGSLPGKRGRIDPYAQEFALAGLGIAREYGLDGRLDVSIASLPERVRRSELDEIAHGLLVFNKVAGLEDAVYATAAAKSDLPTQTRARAVENLAAHTDSSTLATLSDLVHGRRTELRQSAAMALGEHGHELALPTLRTAYDMEKEPITRGFLLLSIGKRADEDAIDFLIEELREGPNTARPWCALALGIAARLTESEAARAAIRDSFEDEGNAEARSAYLLAMGIGRDEAARHMLAEAAIAGASADSRMYASQALGLIGGSEDREALLLALEHESVPLSRIVIAQSLGSFSDVRDIDTMVDILREQRDATLQGPLAVAFALHGSAEITESLLELLEEEKLEYGAEATAIDASGLLLSRHPGLVLFELGRQANFNVLPIWASGLLRFTL